MGKKAQILPKKPLSPFFLYRNEVYEQVKTDNPEAKVSQIVKTIVTMWQNVDSETKKRLQSQHLKIKEIFQLQETKNNHEKQRKLSAKIQEEEHSNKQESQNQSQEVKSNVKSKGKRNMKQTNKLNKAKVQQMKSKQMEHQKSKSRITNKSQTKTSGGRKTKK